MKKAAPTKKATKGADKPASGKATTKTTGTKSVKTVPETPKTAQPPITPKTPKPPATPKEPVTPKPPATPKTPKAPTTKPAASKPAASKPAAARPSTARPATSSGTTKSTTTTTTTTTAKRPATATTSSTKSTKIPAAATKAPKPSTSADPAKPSKPTKPAATTTTTATTSTSATPSTTRPASSTKPNGTSTGSTKPTTTATKPSTSASTANGAAKTKASTSKVSPRDAATRPATAVPSIATPKPSTAAKARPATASASSSAEPKKATTPRGEVKGKSPRDAPSLAPSKSPRADVPLKSPRKSPRNNVAISRAATISELSAEPRAPLSPGSRSVSVGGLQSNITRAAPAGRRKPTVNPVKSRQGTPIREREAAPRERVSAGFLSGMGVLASMGDGQEIGQMQLRKVSDDKPKPLLIQVKGRRNVSARAVETSFKSLNRGDAFVLIDAATRKIFEWRGASANKMEIAKAMDIAGRVKNKEFGGRAEMFVLEDGKNDQNPTFWEIIGKGPITPADKAGDDEDEDKVVRQDYLFAIAEPIPGKLELHQIAKNKFNKDTLQTGQVYLIDCLTELYMWVGRGCANARRSFIAAKAQEALTAVKVRPKWVPISRVIEGAEPEIFKEKFCDWPSTLPITMAAIPKGNVAAKAAVKFDVATMFAHAKRDDRNIDDGAGKVEIWRVKDHSKEPIESAMYGQFFDTESYVILYKYVIKNRDMYIIYFWQGKKSSITEKGSSALLTMDLDESIGGSAVHVRVVQNKEPKHFMKLFRGSIIVHKACDAEDGASAVPLTALYQIRGCNVVPDASCDVRAVQLVNLNASYLNANDVFLLNSPEKQFIWMGANSCKFYSISETTLSQLGTAIKGTREQVFIREGEEPADFWECLGGRSDYYKTAWKHIPRLFHCSSASGSFKVEEVVEYDQEDLDAGHLHILDTSLDVFLWTGQRATLQEEKKLAMETVLDYSKRKRERDEREKKEGDGEGEGEGGSQVVGRGDVYSVYDHKEPYEFKANFHCWDDSKSKPCDSSNVVRVEDLLKELSRNYTLDELRNAPKMLDSTKLENYLSAEEFLFVFKLDKEAFANQTLWKQEQQKKSVGLY